jgi:cell division protein FtsQ
MKKWMKIALIGLGVIILFTIVSVSYKAQSNTVMDKPEIIVPENGENLFVTADELYKRLTSDHILFPGQTFSQLDINKIEKYIEEMGEIRSVKVYTSIGSSWTIKVELRQPIARIFNKYDESFYLDSEGHTLSPRELHTARVVVVNGNIPDRLNSPTVQELINNDSLKSIRKLDDIYRITNYVCKDPFLLAQVAQIHYDKYGDFVLIPQVGGHTIVFGSALSDKEVSEKFEKLKTFYKYGLPYEGWNKYDKIILKYEGQIVCKKKE